jgi:hypothetical protein
MGDVREIQRKVKLYTSDIMSILTKKSFIENRTNQESYQCSACQCGNAGGFMSFSVIWLHCFVMNLINLTTVDLYYLYLIQHVQLCA